MIRVEPFAAHHLALIDVQPSQRGNLMPAEYYAEAGAAWTAFAPDGRAICAAGFAWIGPGYAHAWAVLAGNKRSSMVEITRVARAAIAASGFRRIDLFCDARNEPAIRWANLLGFSLEGVKRSALPDGGDVLVFAIVRENREQGALWQKAA